MSFAAHHPLTNCQAQHHRAGADPTGVTMVLGRMFKLWRSRINERRALAMLEYRDLRDMGVSRWDVEHELSKPFWRD